ncbi:MAG TPA: carbohydrate porin [Verrucomicrobiae bacterium]
MRNVNEVKETVSLDLYAGVRLWHGAEFHVDGLMWQGFGLSATHGAEAFPNGEAFRVGTKVPNVTFARAFIQQTIGLGGEQEVMEDDALQLPRKEDVSRLTLTLGKMSAKDIFDNNTYANDPRSQFMSWSLMANAAWDYPADALGYITGFAAELNQPTWALRAGLFQMPRSANGVALDPNYLDAWGLIGEFERRFAICEHPGAIGFMAYLNRAHMGSYQESLDAPARPVDIQATRKYRYKFGFGLNAEQEITKHLGAFFRLGWSDGQNEAWAFNDVDRAASFGLSLKGAMWRRPNDTVGLAGVINAASTVHQEFFAVGGVGILAGDGKLSYGLEKSMETYYDFELCKHAHATLDYQFITNPAFNRDRGPISVISARLHWSF